MNLNILENVTGRAKLFGSKYLKNGVQYLKIDRCEVKMKSGKIRAYFRNLFNGNEALEKVANDVINQNLDQLVDDMTQPIARIMARKLQQMSNQVFAKEPFEAFFPLR